MSTGVGTIDITAVGGNGSLANDGLVMFGTSTFDASISHYGTSGDIIVNAIGGTGSSGAFNRGATLLAWSSIEAIGGANIVVNGTGGSGVDYNEGIVLDGENAFIGKTFSLLPNSRPGAVTLTGIGGSGGRFNNGVHLLNQGRVEYDGTDELTINATSGTGISSDAVEISNGGVFSSTTINFVADVVILGPDGGIQGNINATGNLVNGGVVSLGQFSIEGDYTQSSTGVFAIDLQGLTPDRHSTSFWSAKT